LRRLLGWSITDHRSPTTYALSSAWMPCGRQWPHAAGGAISLMASYFTRTTACLSLGIAQSMGTVGDSMDNSMAESFFSSFKREVADGEQFATRSEARREIFVWLNWYNVTRLRSSLDDCPPIEYEQHLGEHLLVA
jgi:transposase InsO family protein